MKFILTFDGELFPNGDPTEKWTVRRHLHPQLQELWSIHQQLQTLKQNPNCAEIERGGRRFLPLVRKTLALECSLKILFLRKEDAGRVYQGGDLDNKIKTLLDGLSVPQREQVIPDATIDDPIYCLVEDDALITGLEISTHRLLSRPNASKHEVRLIIEVDVSVKSSLQWG